MPLMKIDHADTRCSWCRLVNSGPCDGCREIERAAPGEARLYARFAMAEGSFRRALENRDYQKRLRESGERSARAVIEECRQWKAHARGTIQLAQDVIESRAETFCLQYQVVLRARVFLKTPTDEERDKLRRAVDAVDEHTTRTPNSRF